MHSPTSSGQVTELEYFQQGYPSVESEFVTSWSPMAILLAEWMVKITGVRKGFGSYGILA